MLSQSVKGKVAKSTFITSTSSTSPTDITIDLSKYEYLIIRAANLDSTSIYGSDIHPVDSLSPGTIYNILRYFNVLSGNFTGSLKYVSGNSFQIYTSNNGYKIEVYGIEK